MGGRATGLSAANRSIIYEHHCPAGPGEKVRGGHAGDPGADDTNVRSNVLRQ
jgi:hypothetical protein